MHTTMQTLGRVAIIGGGVLVALRQRVLLRGAAELPVPQKAAIYRAGLRARPGDSRSVGRGVLLAACVAGAECARLLAQGVDRAERSAMLLDAAAAARR